MELWEGAILLVGGLVLVQYMTNRNSQVQSTIAAGAANTITPGGTMGTTNQSNLTNLTNTAGGTPTTAGEPLEPAQPPLVGSPLPVKGTAMFVPTTTSLVQKLNPPAPARPIISPMIPTRPMEMHL